MNKNLKYIAIACGIVFAGAVIYTYGVRRTISYSQSDNSFEHQERTSDNVGDKTNTNCDFKASYGGFTNEVFSDGFFDKLGWQVRPSETMDAMEYNYTATCDCDISVGGKEFATKQIVISGKLQYNLVSSASNPDPDGKCEICYMLCGEYYNAMRHDTEFTAPRPQVVTAAKNVMYNILAVNPDISELTVVE